MFLFKSEWDKNWISIGWRQIKYNHIILYIMLGDIKKICDFCDHKTSRSLYDKMSFNSFRGSISFTISSFMRTRTLFVQKNVINFSPYGGILLLITDWNSTWDYWWLAGEDAVTIIIQPYGLIIHSSTKAMSWNYRMRLNNFQLC